jgi:DNA-binding NtrC family response regulator
LENLLERAYVIEDSPMLTSAGFPGELFAATSPSPDEPINYSRTLAEIRRKGIEDIERRYLRELLAHNRGRIKESAAAAGITTRQLHKLLTKYGIRKEDFKSNSSHK